MVYRLILIATSFVANALPETRFRLRSDLPRPPAEKVRFCNENTKLIKERLSGQTAQYHYELDPSSIVVDSSQALLTANLNIVSQDPLGIAEQLNLYLWFY
jgi:hypothetical protein